MAVCPVLADATAARPSNLATAARRSDLVAASCRVRYCTQPGKWLRLANLAVYEQLAPLGNQSQQSLLRFDKLIYPLGH